MYLTEVSQVVDLNLPPGRYKIKLVGANTGYTAADTVIFALQFRSTFTMMKYGVRYLQLQMPHNHWSQVNGNLQWEADYFGPFQMDIIDMSTAIAPVEPLRFVEGTYYFDVEPWYPTNQQHVV